MRSLFLAALLLGACRSATPPDTSAVRESVAAPGKLTFAGVKALVAEKGLRTIDALLAALPPEQRRTYLLLKSSRSTQDADPRAPRVLLYNDDASFVMTFNGEAMQNGYDRLETVEYDAGSGKFTFREIEFPGDASIDEPVAYSGDNPSSCNGCHRSPARPIFDQWPAWPDAFFSVGQEAPGAAWESFVKDGMGKGRYARLEGIADYATPERVRAGEPAASFNRLLLAEIDGMIRGEVARHPKYGAWKNAFEAALAGCEDVPAFLPEAERAGFTRTYAQVAQDAKAKNPAVSPVIVGLRWLFENSGRSTRHWSPTFDPRYTYVRDGESGDGPRIARFFPEVPCASLK